MHLPLFIWFVNNSCLHFLFAVVCFGCTFCPFRDLENFRWGRPFIHLGNQRIFVEVSSSSIQGLREFSLRYRLRPFKDLKEFCLNVNLVAPFQGRPISVFGISLPQLLARRLRLHCLSFKMIYIPMGNFIWTMYNEFNLNDVHPFKESYRFFIWTKYSHLRNLIIFYLDYVHLFKKSYRLLFGRCTLYIHLRNFIIFHLDDVHPFKESYRPLSQSGFPHSDGDFSLREREITRIYELLSSTFI